MDVTRVRIDTEVEAYPVLSIREDERGVSDVEVPDEMLDRLAAAYAAVDAVELEIMRYVAARYPTFGAVVEWLADREEEQPPNPGDASAG